MFWAMSSKSGMGRLVQRHASSSKSSNEKVKPLNHPQTILTAACYNSVPIAAMFNQRMLNQCSLWTAADEFRLAYSTRDIFFTRLLEGPKLNESNIFQGPRIGVVNGHPLISKGPLLDTPYEALVYYVLFGPSSRTQPPTHPPTHHCHALRAAPVVVQG